MRYNVAQLLKEPIGSTRRYQVEQVFNGTLAAADKVSGQVQLLRTHQGVLVNAKLDTRSNFSCSRCLSESSRPSTLLIEEESFPTVDLHTGRKLPPPTEDEEALRIDSRHILDLTEVLRQYLISDTPIKPLCRPDCLGLCQQCGANLNQAQCDCQAGQPDHRWGALSALLN